jgi:hypothetical protein
MSNYLKALATAAKKLLPKKQFKNAHYQARASAGGKARAEKINKAPTKVQALIISKDHFSKEQASEWAAKHGFKGEPEETSNSYRYMDAKPKNFKKLKTIAMSEGIKGVVGKYMEKAEPSPEDIPEVQNPQVDGDKEIDPSEPDDKVDPAAPKPKPTTPPDDKLKKSSPSSSSVHVASTDWQKDPVAYVARKALDMEGPDVSNDQSGVGNELDEEPLMKLHIGSGPFRKEGHLGIDTYPHDTATMVHDPGLGLPLPDESASEIILHNLHKMDHVDPKGLLSEIQRVLSPGGYLAYEGPNQLQNIPPNLVMTNHETKVGKSEEEQPEWHKQEFTRLAYPDAATANDAEPRIGISNYDNLPADALVAMEQVGAEWSDAITSGQGNRLHGYASQGALNQENPTVSKAEDEIEVAKIATEIEEHIHVDDHVEHIMETITKGFDDTKEVPIMKLDLHKKLVYGVVLEPDSVDAQEDVISADDIEAAAHHYLKTSRVVGSSHAKPINMAHPVESYIAPQDFQTEGGQYGNQTIKKGSWVLGVKVEDPDEWNKVLNGDYQAFSVGGFGLREDLTGQ